MKKIISIFILFFILSFNIFAQENIFEQELNFPKYKLNIDTFYIPPSLKNDTIKCVMLVTKCNGCKAIQMIGFKVLESIKRENVNSYYKHQDIYFVKKYLNSKLEELNKNIIVWQSKDKK